MLNLLVELFVSVVLCGVFIFFSFLNAPAEAGAIGEDDMLPSATDEPALLLAQELPLYTVLTRYVSLNEETACGIAYRWVLLNALHYSPREVYTEEYLREWGSGVGDGDVGSSNSSNNNNNNNISSEEGAGDSGLGRYGHVSPSPSPSPLPPGVGGVKGPSSRRARRRPRRGLNGPTSAAPPTPLRRESAHWVNVVLRWVGFLYLGGGTVRPEVWTDHLLYATEKVLASLNASYAEKMQARAAVARLVGSHLTGGGQQQQQQQQQRPLPPQHFLSSAAPSSLNAAKSLVRVESLELGAGLLGGPSRELRRPPLSTMDGVNRSAGMDASALPSYLSSTLPTGAAGGPASLTSPTLSSMAATTTTAAATSGGMSSVSPPLHAHERPPPNSAIAAASVLLSSSMAGIGSVLADVVSSVTTGNNHATNNPTTTSNPTGNNNNGASRNGGAGDGGSGAGSVTGDFTTTTTSGGSSGAQLGVVLPRVEGDVISLEEAYVCEDSARDAAKGDASSNSDSHHHHRHLSQPAAAPQPSSSSSSPLRCFAVPLFYDDQRFHLRLGCCLPLGALLPVALCVPPDVLTLDCAVAIRRIIFNGHLYAALHGARVELSFPVAPQFTAVVAVMPDGAGGRRDSHGGSSSSGNHNHNNNNYPNSRNGGGGGNGIGHGHGYGFFGGQQAMYGSMGAAAGAPRALGHAFTAVNTTRNEVTAVREAPSSMASFPVYSHAGNVASMRATTTASTSASGINERNEKVQEVVLLAVRRVIESLTYPNVLAGQLVCQPAAPNAGGGGSGGVAENKLSMKWQRTTASLPLRM